MLHPRAVHLSMCVKGLTLVLLSCLSGCALTQQYLLDRCKTRAYVRSIIPDYLSTRFHSQSPVRLAILPFTAPANLAYRGPEIPGVGNIIARQLHAELVASNQFPIVELFNRQDWPGKSDEFSTGNFGALRTARDAGYDLVLTGKVLPVQAIDKMTVEFKLIEVEGGITIWYGNTVARTHIQQSQKELGFFGFGQETPSNIGTNELASTSAACIAAAITSEEEVSTSFWPW
jgi:hypothetical protein